MQRGERGLHSVPLLGLVPSGWFGLLQRVDPGQHLLLHVVYLVLQQIFQAVRLRGAVAPTVLLQRTEGDRHWVRGLRGTLPPAPLNSLTHVLCTLGETYKLVLTVSHSPNLALNNTFTQCFSQHQSAHAWFRDETVKTEQHRSTA